MVNLWIYCAGCDYDMLSQVAKETYKWVSS